MKKTNGSKISLGLMYTGLSRSIKYFLLEFRDWFSANNGSPSQTFDRVLNIPLESMAPTVFLFSFIEGLYFQLTLVLEHFRWIKGFKQFMTLFVFQPENLLKVNYRTPPLLLNISNIILRSTQKTLEIVIFTKIHMRSENICY